MIRPVRYEWREGAMRPLKYFAKYCAETFTDGDAYVLVELEDRNMSAHAGFFARLQNAFDNLPENDGRFTSAEQLRKWCLTYTEFCRVSVYEAKSAAEAHRFLDHCARDPEFSRCEIKSNYHVWRYVPDSQAVAAMPNNRTFRKSCEAVEIVLARQLGVDVDELRNARSA